jgi:hypothetical protein
MASRFVDNPGTMVAMPVDQPRNDDPRKLRGLLSKALDLAGDHQLTSVVVGMSGLADDLLFPEVVDFVGSALRADDSIFRMTRNRAIFFIADIDPTRAAEIMERVINGFRERFAPADQPDLSLSYFEVTPGMKNLTLKDILPALFAPPPESH